MWVWRKIEKISWAERVTNEEVLQRDQKTRSMLDTVRQHQPPTQMDRTHPATWFAAGGYNGRQDDGKRDKRTKAHTNDRRHHKQRLRDFEEKCRRQEFVINLPLSRRPEEEKKYSNTFIRCGGTLNDSFIATFPRRMAAKISKSIDLAKMKQKFGSIFFDTHCSLNGQKAYIKLPAIEKQTCTHRKARIYHLIHLKINISLPKPL